MQTAGDGASVDDHLAIVNQRSGVERAPEPEIPRETIYLWNAWTELHNARGSSGFAPNPISWRDIDAYRRAVQMDLVPWEVRAVRQIDDAFLASWAEANQGDGG